MTQKRKNIPILSLPEFFQNFVNLEVLSGVALLLFSAAALFLSNSVWSQGYNDFFHTSVGFTIGELRIHHTLRYWINEGLMAIFFFVIGLEIKREIKYGELSEPRKVILPVIAAAGGALIPALLYYSFNAGTSGSRGWGIPMATDIAFVLGIIAMLGKRVPYSIKIFVLAFAIIDDLIAIVIIAVFYTEDLNFISMIIGFGLIAAGTLLNVSGIYQNFFFLLIGIASWFAIHDSGIHPTLAGVAMALAIPINHKTHAGKNKNTPLRDLISTLHPLSSFFIVPVFALANAGVTMNKEALSSLGHPVSVGIIAGLLLGKPLGILTSTYITVRTGLSPLPEGARWSHIFAMACMGGMGFTLSLFISVLAFGESEELAVAKFGVLAGSLMSAIAGVILFLLKRKRSPASPQSENNT